VIDILPQQIKALPHSEECEQAVLGSILLRPDRIEEAIPRLKPEHFYSERNQILYRTFLDLWPDTEIDLRSVQALLEQRGQFDVIGGLAYLTQLDLMLPDHGRIEIYIAIILERAARRSLIQHSGEIIRRALGGDVSVEEIASSSAVFLDSLINAGAAGQEFRPLNEWIEPLLARLDGDDDGPEGAHSGISGLDALTTGFRPSHFWIIGGEQRSGKTVLLEQILDNEVSGGRPAGFFSLEMTAAEVLERQIARRANINHKRLRIRRITPADMTAIIRCVRQQMSSERGRLYIDDTPGLTVDQICSKTRKLKREHPNLRLVGLDYLGLVEREAVAREDLSVNRMTRRFKNLAKELGICFIANHQIVRSAVRAGGKPQLADLKEGGESDADGALLIYREKDPDNKGLLLPHGCITVAKNRHGESGEIAAALDGPHMQWLELSNREAPEPRDWRNE